MFASSVERKFEISAVLAVLVSLFNRMQRWNETMEWNGTVVGSTRAQLLRRSVQHSTDWTAKVSRSLFIFD